MSFQDNYGQPEHESIEANPFVKGNLWVVSTAESLNDAQSTGEWIQSDTVREVRR